MRGEFRKRWDGPPLAPPLHFDGAARGGHDTLARRRECYKSPPDSLTPDARSIRQRSLLGRRISAIPHMRRSRRARRPSNQTSPEFRRAGSKRPPVQRLSTAKGARRYFGLFGIRVSYRGLRHRRARAAQPPALCGSRSGVRRARGRIPAPFVPNVFAEAALFCDAAGTIFEQERVYHPAAVRESDDALCQFSGRAGGLSSQEAREARFKLFNGYGQGCRSRNGRCCLVAESVSRVARSRP